MNRKDVSKIVERLEEILKPHCTKFDVAGSYRREVSECGDLEIVCTFDKAKLTKIGIAIMGEGIGIKSGRFTRDARYIKLITKGGFQIDLFIPQEHDYYRILAIRTGSADFAHLRLARTWNQKGWVGTADGLRRKEQCVMKGQAWHCVESSPTLPPAWESEEDFFEWLDLDWVELNERR